MKETINNHDKIDDYHKNPQIIIKKGCDIRVNQHYPWIFSNEIANFSELKTLKLGSLVNIFDGRSNFIGSGYFNYKSLIAVRMLSFGHIVNLDIDFFQSRISKALAMRHNLLENNILFCRIVHSEADMLPGLVIDRFDDIFICQITTAGMQNCKELIINAINNIFGCKVKVFFSNNVEARRLETLDDKPDINHTDIPQLITVQENNLSFLANLQDGQKTGWFFDQRRNRLFIREISNNKRVFDGFCYLGAFGFNALIGNARQVVFADSSLQATELVKLTANKFYNQYQEKITVINQKIFTLLEDEEFIKNKFDIVLLDPPAFIKSKKDFFAGIKGYEKLVKLACKITANNGILMLSSCSHNAKFDDLLKACNDGFRKANRVAKLISSCTADIDHPIHPALKESEYLKSLCFFLE